MAKKPSHSTSGPRASQRGRNAPESSLPKFPAEGGVGRPSAPPSAADSEFDEIESDLSAPATAQDDLESRLTAGMAAGELDFTGAPGEGEDDPVAARSASGSARSAAEREASPRVARVAGPDPRAGDEEPKEGEDGTSGDADEDAEAPTAGSAGRPARARGFGSAEWAALGGFALLALLGGMLFMKFLYAHPAPTQGRGLPSRFEGPLGGAAVKLSGAESGWSDRVNEANARPEEKVLPTIMLTLDASHSSTGFVRVEFVDSEDRIRGDVMTVALEGGRFKDTGRGEIIEDGGVKARLTGTVGFRSPALFASYLGGDEPRWSVRVKEGPDSSDGPWTELGAALISNKKQ